jgi:hypothetical protein
LPRLGDPADERRLFPTWNGTKNYGKAIKRACERAGVKWTANQLRKRRATKAFEQAGEETAGQVLGHAPGSAVTRKHYIDPSNDQARGFAREDGFAHPAPSPGELQMLSQREAGEQ